jgi:hypothetical protein
MRLTQDKVPMLFLGEIVYELQPSSFSLNGKPPIQWVPGALSLGIKRPGREADH